MRNACAPLRRLGLDLPVEQLGEEREVDWQARLPVGAPVGIVLRRQPVKRAPELAQLPLDVDLVPLHKLALQADDLAQPQPGVGDRDQPGQRRDHRGASLATVPRWVAVPTAEGAALRDAR
jgi:hypothetical protein